MWLQPYSTANNSIFHKMTMAANKTIFRYFRHYLNSKTLEHESTKHNIAMKGTKTMERSFLLCFCSNAPRSFLSHWRGIMSTIVGLGRHIGRLSTDSRSTIGRQSTDKCAHIGWCIGRQSVDYRSTIGQLDI